MKFVCKKCNYRFESETDQKERPCSYCGEKAVINEPDAEKLLEDVE